MGTRRKVDMRLQRFTMKRDYPDFECSMQNGSLVCKGKIQPTSMSAIYTVRITCGLDSAPVARVEDPALHPRSDGGKIPHTYADDQPCLYYPKRRDWTPERPISETIVPWLSLWLFYYEVWHVTGEWKGGGIHNGKEDPFPVEAISTSTTAIP